MNEIEKMEAEKRELNALVNRGVKFSIEDTRLQRPEGFFGFLKKRVPVKLEKTFVIEEPTLRTLDLITAEALEMPIDENVMTGTNSLSAAKSMTHEYAKRCARIVALSVLGSEYVTSIDGTPKMKYADKKLSDLTELFFRTIKPSKLVQLALLLNTMMNLGDFMNSIRLISASRTTQPDQVEEERQD